MNLWFELRYAWRLSKKSWGYSLMCASVVTLSVGLAVWMAAITYSELMKPLGFPGSQRWYSLQIAARAAGTARPSMDAYTLQELLKQNHGTDYMGAFTNRDAVVSEGHASTTLRAAAISPRVLAATQVPPLMGRVFEDGDSQSGATAVAILSFDTWQNYFAADPAIVGKTARIDSAPVQIVGVMPRDFYEFQDFELWLPLHMPQLSRPAVSQMTLSPLVVLDRAQNIEAVEAGMQAAVDTANRDYPDLFDSGRHIKLIPAYRMYTHAEVPIMAMLNLLVGAVMLLGCVNISMVFLARLLERSRELALRSALGASRPRLLRQCLLEAGVVIPLGLIAGYGLAGILIRWVQGLITYSAQVNAGGRPANLPVLRPVDLLAAVMAATAIWLLSTIIPAWRITRQDAAAVLAGSGKGASVRGGNKSVGLIVGLQVVISSIVLVTCGNVVLAVRKEVQKPTGLAMAQVMVTTAPTVFDARYSKDTDRLRYWDELASAVEGRIPSAEACFATALPMRPANASIAIETQQGTANRGSLSLPLAVVSENYFNLMGLRLRSGRLFDGTDTQTSLKVAVLDERMANRYWPDGDAVGKRLQLNPSENGPRLTVIGVVSGVSAGPYRTDVGVIYQPLRQAAPAEFLLMVRLPATAKDHRADLRAAAFSVDRDLPLHNPQMLDEYLAAQEMRFSSLTSTVIAAAIITTLLAASGLFGLISRSVGQRTQEVGLRRALGATPWSATAMFRHQGAMYLSVAILGLGAGIGTMPLLSAAIPNILERVSLVTFGVVLVMAGVIFAASYLPTRRAVALEPGDALRHE